MIGGIQWTNRKQEQLKLVFFIPLYNAINEQKQQLNAKSCNFLNFLTSNHKIQI